MTMPIDATETSELPHASGNLIRDRARILRDSKRMKSGYNREDVDRLVKDACEQIDHLSALAAKQNTQLQTLWTELQARRSGVLPDSSMQGPTGTMLMELQRNAMEQGDQTLEHAALQAREIVAAAREQAQAIMGEAEELKAPADLQRMLADMVDFMQRTATAMANGARHLQTHVDTAPLPTLDMKAIEIRPGDWLIFGKGRRYPMVEVTHVDVATDRRMVGVFLAGYTSAVTQFDAEADVQVARAPATQPSE